MQRQLRLRTLTLCYELQRKRVKRLSCRIRADGSVWVSAPAQLSLAQIELWLTGKEAWLRKALAQMDAAREAGQNELADGADFRFWGETLRLCLEQGARSAVHREGDRLVLRVADPGDEALKRRAVERFRKRSCEERIGALCREVYPAFAARGVAFPALRYRRMSSRWGSCAVQTGRLCFNTRLSELPEGCARYVVVHEFAHFLQPNHSPAFYAEVERVLPDWRFYRAALKQAGR